MIIGEGCLASVRGWAPDGRERKSGLMGCKGLVQELKVEVERNHESMLSGLRRRE